MRIALVITELDPGGAELCLTELALYLASHGHSVKVWAIGPPPPSGRNGLVQRLNSAGIDVQFGSARGTLDSWRVIRWLKHELRAFQPDLVQSMLWHANMMTAGALWFDRVPWVGGMRVSEPRSGRWRLERLASRRMQRMVCVSQDVYQHALHKQRIASDKLVVIPNGVSLRLLDDSLPPVQWPKHGASATAYRMLFVGRLEEQKGIVSLIEHMPEIFKGHDDWSLAIMGLGSLLATLHAKIESARLDRRIRLLGWEPNAPSWMNAADLLLLPAQYEGMPNVLLEAMAIGKPFVAFSVDGVRQLVESSSGYPEALSAAQLATPGDWNKFIQLVRNQMIDPPLRSQCGQANRQHVAKHFRLEDQLAKYIELYETLV